MQTKEQLVDGIHELEQDMRNAAGKIHIQIKVRKSINRLRNKLFRLGYLYTSGKLVKRDI